MSTAGFKKMEGAVDISRYEIVWACDATIHMRFSCQVHDVSDVVLVDHAKNFGLITQINFFKDVSWMIAVNAFEIL